MSSTQSHYGAGRAHPFTPDVIEVLFSSDGPKFTEACERILKQKLAADPSTDKFKMLYDRMEMTYRQGTGPVGAARCDAVFQYIVGIVDGLSGEYRDQMDQFINRQLHGHRNRLENIRRGGQPDDIL